IHDRLETLMTMIWYPCTVATLSKRNKQIIEDAFNTSVDPDNHNLIESRLHDFGFRGCTSVEQSVIGGSAHCVWFALFHYIQFVLFMILVEFYRNRYLGFRLLCSI